MKPIAVQEEESLAHKMSQSMRTDSVRKHPNRHDEGASRCIILT